MGQREKAQNTQLFLTRGIPKWLHIQVIQDGTPSLGTTPQAPSWCLTSPKQTKNLTIALRRGLNTSCGTAKTWLMLTRTTTVALPTLISTLCLKRHRRI